MDLENYLLKNSKEEEISLIVKSLGDAAIEISNTIRSIKPQESISNNDRKLNSDGDIQKPLDIISDEILVRFLENLLESRPKLCLMAFEYHHQNLFFYHYLNLFFPL